MEAEKISSKGTARVSCEEWKEIKGYEGLYEVSNFGKVRSINHKMKQKTKGGVIIERSIKGKVLKGNPDKDGYLQVYLCKNGKSKPRKIHRLVAEHFIPIEEGRNIVNHIDSNRTNNSFLNLEWCTISENVLHAYRYGNQKPVHPKKVSQFDKDGTLLNEWSSMKEAGRKTGIRPAGISRVCNQEKGTAGGYIWRFTK